MDGIHVLRVNERYGNEMGFAKRVLAFGRFARTARKLVSRLDADLVFATSTPLTVGIPGMKGARRLGVPFVFEVRDLWPEMLIALGVISVLDLAEIGVEPLVKEIGIEHELAGKIIAAAAEAAKAQ